MMTQASLLGAVMAILQAHPICVEARVVETKSFSDVKFHFKIRAALVDGAQFQARIYSNAEHIDYAYQLFTDRPLLRWDNKEEFRDLTSFPHHYHDEGGAIHPSPLTGDVARDLTAVLDMVAERLRLISGRL
jgi:hypothetical protein